MSRSAFFVAAFALLSGGCGGGGSGGSSPSGTTDSLVMHYKAQRLILDPLTTSGRYDFGGVSQEGTVFLVRDGITPGYASLNDPGKTFTPIMDRSTDGSVIFAQGDIYKVGANGDALVSLGRTSDTAGNNPPFVFHRATGTVKELPQGYFGCPTSTGELYSSRGVPGSSSGCTKYTPQPDGSWSQTVLFSIPYGGAYYFAGDASGTAMSGPVFGIEPGQTPILLGDVEAAGPPSPARAAYVRNGNMTVLPLPVIGDGSSAMGMNASATVILGQTLDPNALGHVRGIIWYNGKPIDLGRDVLPTWVNSAGVVVGENIIDGTPFVWKGGKMYSVAVTDALYGGTLTGINPTAILDDGRAVGVSTALPAQYYVMTPI